MRENEKIFKKRLEKFQRLLKENEIDGAVIRTLSTFIYFTGTKWLRPSLLIPAEGEPIVIVAKGEKELFMERSWIKNVEEFQKTEDLMAMVTVWIRKNGYNTIGMEFSIERDAYILFYEIFKRLNPGVEIEDVRPLTMQLRMIKDKWELENIRKAGKIAVRGMEVAVETIKPGKSELEIAAEIVRELMLNGSEDPKVYVSATPRAHAEPFRDIKVERGKFVTVVIGADYNNYYANMTRSFFIGEPNGRSKSAIEAMERVHQIALEKTQPGVTFAQVEREIATVYREKGLQEYYITGYAHGVGLLIEEDPITTIVVPHRAMKAQKGMVLAMVHAPLMIPEGAVKKEDTIILGRGLENVTLFDASISP
ncbi:M24 family metallopeptidase [Thermococcus paralvinellae]|uniref:Putative X-Pro dipeptidase n=1 Tax=Thermococcus paralvinellae TaxID=582419 RepID=W0I711_9EURY|nr:Xaa-Pro peptidase family protein [Thermococcus paralvinellae]AHF80245.1 putative X-Pro dipeptidase [Thermococcus paralvinellae]